MKKGIIILILSTIILSGCNQNKKLMVMNTEAYELYKEGEYQLAIEKYNEAVNVNDKLSLTYANRGLAYFELGEIEQALQDLNKAIRLDEKNAVAYSKRGHMKLKSGKVEEAINDFNKVIDLDQSFAHAYGNRGLAYYLLQEYELALADTIRAIALNPMIPQVHNTIALIYTAIGESNKAIQHYSFAIEMWEEYPSLYLGRGMQYYNIGENEKALMDYTKAMELGSKEGYINKGYLEIQMDRQLDAIKIFETYLQEYPMDDIIILEVGMLYQKKHKYQKSIEYFDKLIELREDIYVGYFWKGLSLEYLGKFDEALRMFEKVLEIEPGQPDALKEIDIINELK